MDGVLMTTFDEPTLKAISLNELPEGAWTYLTGGPVESREIG